MEDNVKYCIEPKKDGYIEILCVEDKRFIKRWIYTENGEKCKDDDFYNQTRRAGFFDVFFNPKV